MTSLYVSRSLPFVVFLLMGGTARGAVLEVQPGQYYRDLASAFTYYEDPDGTADIRELVKTPDAFRPVDADRIDFGFSDHTYWLKLEVVNTAPVADERLLAFNVRFMQDLSVYIVRADGDPDEVLNNGRHTPFTDRAYAHRHLTLPITLPPSDALDIYVRYHSEGTTALPLSIETPITFRDLSTFHATKNAAFYSFAAFMLAYSCMFWAVTRTHSFGAYTAYLLTVILYALHMDGYTFQVVWPSLPEWNSFAALPLGLGLSVTAAIFSRMFLATRENLPWLDKGLLTIIGLTVVFMSSAVVFDPTTLKRYAFPYTFVCAVYFLICGVVAYRRAVIGARFYAIGWAGLTGAALVTTFSHFSAGMLAVGLSFEVMKIGIILDATMIGLALLDQYNAVRKTNEMLRERESAAFRDHIRLQDRILRLEQRYNEAHQAAIDRGLQLAGAGHDLRQPLTALRFAVHNLLNDEPVGTDRDRQQLEQTLGYLEQLVDRYMKSTTAGPDFVGRPVELDSTRERCPVQVLLDNIERMFADEAASNGLSLRVLPCRLYVSVDPLVCMRILSNLVSNAIHYTDTGHVTVGCRRRGQNLRIYVIDTGPGLGGALPDDLTEPFQRGTEQGDGYGLGLAICTGLARDHGISFHIGSGPGGGTAAWIELDRADVAEAAQVVSH